MKSKIFIFTTLILVVFLFVITSCNYFLNGNNNTTININLDLSKIVKTSRNVTASNSTEYILKVFAYNAASYKPKDEIENLPLLTQTENKVNINGKVKARLDVEIGLNVIFVAKLYQGEAEEPIYAGKSEVIKIKATDNKVHLVLTRENADIAKIPEMVFVKGGTVTGELPAWLDEPAPEWYKGVFIKDRTVTLSDFYMGKYAVTQEEYASVMEGQKVTVEGVEYTLESNPSYCTIDSTEYTLFSGDEQQKRPVEGVTWYDAVWYCNALSEKEGLTKAYKIEVTEVKKEDGKENYYIYTADVRLVENANGYRLPTEAEWEYAARGGDPTAADWDYMFSGADKAEGVSYDSLKNSGLDSVGWYCYNSINGKTGDTSPSSGEQGYGTHQVGKKAHNRLGLYDMSGNVDEWCYDWYENVNTGEESDPTGASLGLCRVSRGGGWVDSANFKAVAFRGNNYPNTRHNYYGFRVVRTATEVIDHTHTFATDWTSDGTYHWYASTCGHDVTDSKAAHSFYWEVTKEASCTEKGEKKGTCTTCGYEKTEITDEVEHTFGIWEVVTDPTTTTEGISKRICSICNFEETKPIIAIPENFVLIPAGTFQMGSDAGNSRNKPVHQVTITKSFYMGKYEVTQAEYEKYCSYTGSLSPNSSDGVGDGDNYPAYYVSWYDALVYCNKRSMEEGLTPCYRIKESTDPEAWGAVPTSTDSTWDSAICNFEANGYRLPTEAEWEYAARAGDNIVDSLTYSGTSDVNNLGDYAWYTSNSSSKTYEVGTKKANAFGLYDMSGNVGEWCWNWYTDSYDTQKEGGSDPTGASSGISRIARGGNWSRDSSYCAVSSRSFNGPSGFIAGIGFRVVRSATE